MFGIKGHMAYLSLATLMSIAPTSIIAMNNNFEEERSRQASSSTARNESPDNDSDRSSVASNLESEHAWPNHQQGKKQPRLLSRRNSESDLALFEQLPNGIIRGQTVHVHGQNVTYNTYNNTYNFTRVVQQQVPVQPSQQTRQQSELERESVERLNFARSEQTLSPELITSLLKTCPPKLVSASKQFKYSHLQAQASLPKAIILVGKSGVGKSELCRVMAQDAHYALEFISAAFLGSEYQKSSEGDLRHLITTVLKKPQKKTFVVFDEIQAITAGHKNKEKGSYYGAAIAAWGLTV